MIDEYIRKADAIDDLHTQLMYRMGSDDMKRRLDDWVKTLLPADVAQVVRCKHCKHYYFADNRIPQEQRYVCEISGEIWRPDSFCSYGDRKE